MDDKQITDGDLCLWKILSDIEPNNVNIEHTKEGCNGYNRQCEYYLAQKEIYVADKPLSKTGL